MTARGAAGFIREWHGAMAAWDAARGTERIWTRDASVWTGADEASWLGWLAAPDMPPDALADIRARAAAAVPADASTILLVGMGGSSLAAEVIAAVAARPHGAPSLRVLDSTEPTAVSSVLDTADWRRTVTVVASKSGSTLEPNLIFAAALQAATDALGSGEAARRVLVVTDPGSALARRAAALGAATVLGDPAIGGRFSALSPFGLAPAALQQMDLDAFLEPARRMARLCREPAARNPAVQLGAFLAQAAAAGRDKCTLLLSPGLAPIGAWIEQLVAESTGKRGVGIIPIDGEAPGSAAEYGSDRAFVCAGELTERDAELARELAARGHPVFSVDDAKPASLAAEFFRWEFATAVAGAMLRVNPFDQPDVESAKVAARALTDAFERDGALPPPGPEDQDLKAALSSLAPPGYAGFLAYLPMRPDLIASLQRTRVRIRDARGVATSLGFGPRYLHSTGQAFKGGPPGGVFLQLTCDAPDDREVPGRRLTFGTVVAAQAAGDRRVLRERGRRVVHIHLAGELAGALARLDADVAAALA